jgi:hypothetical protein
LRLRSSIPGRPVSAKSSSKCVNGRPRSIITIAKRADWYSGFSPQAFDGGIPLNPPLQRGAGGICLGTAESSEFRTELLTLVIRTPDGDMSPFREFTDDEYNALVSYLKLREVFY